MKDAFKARVFTFLGGGGKQIYMILRLISEGHFLD